MLVLGVLGPVAAWRGTNELPLRGARQHALLAALAVDAGAVVPADVLIERVWGNRLPVNAANALQQQVFKLRRALGGAVVERADPGYRLAVDPEALDSARFERLIESARVRPDDAVPLLDAALALWRGPAFADVAYEDWAAGPAARLDELRLQAEELRIDALVRAGRSADAIHALERLVREHPLRERLHGLRILALYRDGRQAEALGAYTEARATLVEQLGVEPSPELRSLHERVLRQDPMLERRDGGGPEALIGRDAELADLRRLLIDERERLVTLTGPGGVGKSALARGLAATATFVDLSGVQDEAGMLAALATGLGRPEVDGPASFAAAGGIVVLDGLEHLAGAASLVAELLGAAPALQVLVTSRIALRLPGEVVLALAPLTVPEAGAVRSPAQLAADSSAVRLFVERTRAVDSGFRLDDDNADLVARICRALDGLPLALELAATRLWHLSLAELERRLDRRLALLSRGSTGAAPRHRSLRAAIDMSHDLLDERARAVFASLGAFSGGATLEAVEELCGDAVAIDGLAALVEGSLLMRREAAGRSRYEMLDTVAEYAREQLARRGEAERAGERLTRHLLRLAEEAPAGRLYTIDPPMLALLAAEHANFVAALARAAAANDGTTVLRLATALGQHWLRHGHRREGLRWLREGQALAPDAPSGLRARALAYESALDPSDNLRARATALEALRLAVDSDDPRAELTAAGALGMIEGRRGEPEAARRWLERVVAIARRSGDRGLLAFALSDLAYTDLLLGRVELASSACDEAVEIAGELGLVSVQAFSLLNLALALAERDRLEEAILRAREALALAITAKDLEAAAYALGALGAFLTGLRMDEAALRLMGAADALLERLGVELQPLEARLRLQALSALRARVDDDTFDRAWAIGLRTSPEDALGLVGADPLAGAARRGSPST